MLDLVRTRWGWLLAFFGGLMIAAVVVEAFENVLKQHVALSYFVPLLIGHGGNTGSQSNATIIRCDGGVVVQFFLVCCGHEACMAGWGRGIPASKEVELPTLTRIPAVRAQTAPACQQFPKLQASTASTSLVYGCSPRRPLAAGLWHWGRCGLPTCLS